MDIENTQNNSLAKLPLLKQGEYDTWRLRMESYIQLQDYAIWEIIEEGNSFKPVARTTTNEHGEIITPEELNLKFLRSLPTEWGMHVVVWRNKSDLGSISFDDLYNNFKIVEPEVKRSVISSSNSGSQNLAFLSGLSSTNDVNTANVHVSTGSTHVSTASTNNSIACLSDATTYTYLATQPNGSQIVHEDLEQIHEDDLDEMDLKCDTAGYDKKKVECFNCHKLGHLARECRKPRNGTGFDWSYMANKEASANFALMAFSDSKIDVLKRDASFNESDIKALKKQVERLKKEKEDNQFKIDNFENASKSLDQLIGNQISDNNKKGLGYNVPEFEGHGVKVSDCDEDENVVLESLNVQKPKQADQPRKEKRMTSAVGEQEINVVKPTSYWAWRPKIRMINHVYKNTGSCICKQFNSVDPTGRNNVLNLPYFMVKSWLVQYQTVLALAIPGQTTTGGYTLESGEDSLKLIELMDLCTKLIDKVTILENALKQSKESHAQTLTMLMKKVKRLEDKLKL
ncbi:putative ribonuclease H-like domain-containing protein [Tanacetum coccineum]